MLKKILGRGCDEKAYLELYQTTINSLSDAIFSVDGRGNLRFHNAAALALLDTNRDISGENISHLFNLSNEHGEKISILNLVRAATRRTVLDNLSHEYHDGQKIRLFLGISQVKNAKGKLRGAVILARDITKQKNLDEERDEFIAVVSHELRTPVAIAEGALSNLKLMLERNISPEKFPATLDAAHDQILYLASIVNDLSTLSRAQRGVYMDAEPILVTNFMENLLAKYQPEAAAKNLTLRLDLDREISAKTTVSTARMALEEIMQNFITNAIKYTKEGEVVISAKTIREDSAGAKILQKKSPERTAAKREKIEFAVRDSGIGMSASDQKHIFERFWRSEDFRTRETNGTGLGLHVAATLAEKIGAKIKVESALDRGSRFSFRLEKAADQENSPENFA